VLEKTIQVSRRAVQVWLIKKAMANKKGPVKGPFVVSAEALKIGAVKRTRTSTGLPATTSR
jgi:hypothetical protein